MLSKTADADVQEMWEAGLKPTVADIVRLNALALQVERIQGAFALNVLPRVAFLGQTALREPTVGSEMWFAEASRLCDVSAVETYVILRAFSLSRPQSELPDAADEKAVVSAIEGFKASVGFATVRQIAAAVGYATHGFLSAEGESPAPKEADEENPVEETLSFDVGLIRQGMVYRLGSAAELRELPPRALKEMLTQVISREHNKDVRKDAVSAAEDDYMRTLDEITDRLKGERSDG